MSDEEQNDEEEMLTQPKARYKKGDKIDGRYLIHQVLIGGMGEVYLCLDLKENLPYALCAMFSLIKVSLSPLCAASRFRCPNARAG